MECQLCFKSFSRIDNLNRHLSDVHKVQKEVKEHKFKCTLCDAGYTENSSLRRHMKSVHNIDLSEIERKQKAAERERKNIELQKRKEETARAKEEAKAIKKKNNESSKIVPFDLTVHENQGRYLCSCCQRPFVSEEARNHHFNIHQTEKRFKCRQCSKCFQSEKSMHLHEQSCRSNDSITTQPSTLQEGAGYSNALNTLDTDDYEDEEMRHHRSGLNNIFNIYRKKFAPRSTNIMDRLQDAINEGKHQLRVLQETNNSFKVSLSVQATFYRATNPEEITSPPPTFNSDTAVILPTTTLTLLIKTLHDNIIHQLDTFEQNGSGWVLNHLIYLDLHTAQFDPLRASSYLPMPKKVYTRIR